MMCFVDILLARELQCVPDIWSLIEWSDWLTPRNYTNGRYDTIFYLCFCEQQPYSRPDDKEVTDSKVGKSYY